MGQTCAYNFDRNKCACQRYNPYVDYHKFAQSPIDQTEPYIPSGDGATPTAIKLARVRAEFIHYEEFYVNKLRQFEHYYVDPLDVDKNKKTVMARKETHETIFGNIRKIKVFHEQKMLPSIQGAQNVTRDDKKSLGKAFLEHAEALFAVYEPYFLNYEKMINTLQQKQKKPKYKMFLEISREHCQNERLDSFLIRPIQRLTRYEMLLMTLIKQTKKVNKDDQELKYLTAGLEAIQKVNQHINESQRESARLLDEADKQKTHFTGHSCCGHNRKHYKSIEKTNDEEYEEIGEEEKLATKVSQSGLGFERDEKERNV